MSEQLVTFKGTLARAVYVTDRFSVYAMNVDVNKYDVKMNQYHNVSICGELPVLSRGVEYEVTGSEETGKYGISYRVSNIRRDEPLTKQGVRSFLEEIVSPNIAYTITEAYPDIIDRVKNNRLDDIDLSKMHGVGPKSFQKIVDKIIENFYLSDLASQFHGVLTMSMLNKIYEKYPSSDLLKQRLMKEPYKTLTRISGIGFKIADDKILTMQEENIIDFGFDIRTSVDRCLSCIIYLLEQNESDGHTKMNMSVLYKQVDDMVPSCSDKFAKAIDDDVIYYNKSTMDIALSKTYDMEEDIANVIFNNVRNDNVWQYDVEKYRNVDGIELSDEQLKAVDNLCKSSICILNGPAGSGKSFATKTILTGLASDNSKVFILDPENEYTNLAKNMKGSVLDVSSSRDGRINPFQIIDSLDDENADGTNNSFYSHLQFLEEFFRLILVGINADSLELLNKLILETYSLKNITGKTDLSKLTPKDYPIFQDLADLVDSKLEQEKDDYNKSCLKVLSNYLSKFKKGGRNSALWNGYTTFAPQENFVCFNFQKLLANKNNVIANAQMLLVLKWLDNEVIKNRDYNRIYNTNRKIIVAIDEAHVFIDDKYPIALDFMYNLAKRIRKYDGMEIVITQNVKDFVGSPEIARKSSAIINVSQYSLIFSLAPNDMSDLCSLYEKAGQINETESDNIVNLPRGCAFLITGPAKRTNIRIVASEFVQEMFEN